jgi:hypothetical protein
MQESIGCKSNRIRPKCLDIQYISLDTQYEITEYTLVQRITEAYFYLCTACL